MPRAGSQDAPSLEKSIRATRLVAFDFDGVFTDNMVYVSEDGTESVRCFRGDGLGLDKLKRLGIGVIVISTEVNPVVSARCRKLRLRCIQTSNDKYASLKSVADEMGLSLAQVAFVGNDLNDLTCLTAVGLPVVVQNAHPDVVPYARYRTVTPGGHGAVREICDLFARVLTRGEA